MRSSSKIALITGITGQDGSYLAELLIEKGYDVHGITKSVDVSNGWWLPETRSNIKLHRVDVADYKKVGTIFDEVGPSEIYHLASGFQGRSTTGYFPELFETNIKATNFMLDKTESQRAKFLFACSSNIFNGSSSLIYDENTAISPNSLYGIAKSGGFFMTKLFRNKGVFSCSAILANHESPRGKLSFLLRKITNMAVKIKLGQEKMLYLGNINIKRDWGHPKDYMKGLWLMMQQNNPDDYVLGSGKSHSIEEVLDIAFSYLGLDWRKYINVDKKLVRNEKKEVKIKSDKAKNILGWKTEISFKEIIIEMIDSDLKTLQE